MLLCALLAFLTFIFKFPYTAIYEVFLTRYSGSRRILISLALELSTVRSCFGASNSRAQAIVHFPFCFLFHLPCAACCPFLYDRPQNAPKLFFFPRIPPPQLPHFFHDVCSTLVQTKHLLRQQSISNHQKVSSKFCFPPRL